MLAGIHPSSFAGSSHIFYKVYKTRPHRRLVEAPRRLRERKGFASSSAAGRAFSSNGPARAFEQRPALSFSKLKHQHHTHSTHSAQQEPAPFSGLHNGIPDRSQKSIKRAELDGARC